MILPNFPQKKLHEIEKMLGYIRCPSPLGSATGNFWVRRVGEGGRLELERVSVDQKWRIYTDKIWTPGPTFFIFIQFLGKFDEI